MTSPRTPPLSSADNEQFSVREAERAAVRAESGTWLERKTDVSKLRVAPRFAALVAKAEGERK